MSHLALPPVAPIDHANRLLRILTMKNDRRASWPIRSALDLIRNLGLPTPAIRTVQRKD